MNPLSLSQQRILAIALAGVAIAILFLGAIRPLVDYIADRSDERDSALRLLGRNLALVRQAPTIQTTLDAAAKSPRWGRFYNVPKAADATLQLETDLRSLIAIPNQPTSMIAESPSPLGSLTRVSVKISLSVTIDQLSDLLGRLHQHPRLLKIESLAVQSPESQIVDTNPPLAVQAEISGFMVTPVRGKS